jgi:hypothetical protein
VGKGALLGPSAWAKSRARRAHAATVRQAILPTLRSRTRAQVDPAGQRLFRLDDAEARIVGRKFEQHRTLENRPDEITAIDLLGRPLLARAVIISACAASQAAPNATWCTNARVTAGDDVRRRYARPRSPSLPRYDGSDPLITNC